MHGPEPEMLSKSNSMTRKAVASLGLSKVSHVTLQAAVPIPPVSTAGHVTISDSPWPQTHKEGKEGDN